ncbi:hypothetical protein ABES02_19170 [Neobacillus pocheonensis]|uniref:hypothetical protein n=1 Tax=Neobacillus pocheonensis TaxID=363869 RepID=UPI003D2D9671
MTELVGTCLACKKDIYCLDGFLNGVLTNEKEIYCFNCYENTKNDEKNPQN